MIVFISPPTTARTDWIFWMTDGTTPGTTLFADIAAGGESSRTGSSVAKPTMADTGKSIIFSASDGLLGIELWKSDKHGTFQLQDIAPGASSSNPESMTVTKKLVFFLANDNSSGRELWVMPDNAAKGPAREESRAQVPKRH